MESTTSTASVTTRVSAASQLTKRSRRLPVQASAHRLKPSKQSWTMMAGTTQLSRMQQILSPQRQVNQLEKLRET